MILFVASLLLVANDPAPAAAPVQQTAEAEAKPKPKKVCRRIETSNSRMAKRVCTTDPDYKEQEGVNAADLQRMGAR